MNSKVVDVIWGVNKLNSNVEFQTNFKSPIKIEYSVLEILYGVVSNSKSSIKRGFKKHAGLPPTRFRKLCIDKKGYITATIYSLAVHHVLLPEYILIKCV